MTPGFASAACVGAHPADVDDLAADAAGVRSRATSHASVPPGLGLTMGYTLTYLSLLVMLPLAALSILAAELPASELWASATSPRAIAAYTATLGASLIAAALDVVLGTLLAWTLVRHRFRGHGVIDAIVDLPFALPTAVAGLALTGVLAPTGWLERVLEPRGYEAVVSQVGITLALVVIGLPFVVRTVQPVLEQLAVPRERTRIRVIVRVLAPALRTGLALAFARAIGEYGAVVLVAGSGVPATTTLALVMLMVAFAMLIAISLGARRRAVRAAGHGVEKPEIRDDPQS